MFPRIPRALAGHTETSCLHPAPAATELPAPGPSVCLLSPQPLGARARLWSRGAVTWRQVQSKQGPQHAAGHGQPGVSTAPGAQPPGDSGPARPGGSRQLMEPRCDTPCWRSRTQARGPVTHFSGRVPRGPKLGSGCGFRHSPTGTVLGLLQCQLRSRPADADIRNFLRIPGESFKARRRTA